MPAVSAARDGRPAHVPCIPVVPAPSSSPPHGREHHDHHGGRLSCWAAPRQVSVRLRGDDTHRRHLHSAHACHDPSAGPATPGLPPQLRSYSALARPWHLPGVNRPDRGRRQIRVSRISSVVLDRTHLRTEPSCWIRPWPFSRCSRYGGCPRRSRRRARQPDQGGSPGWKICGKTAYPAEMPVLPKPAAPPVPGSPAVEVAGVPAGTMTGAVITYLDNATPAP